MSDSLEVIIQKDQPFSPWVHFDSMSPTNTDRNNRMDLSSRLFLYFFFSAWSQIYQFLDTSPILREEPQRLSQKNIV